MSCGSFILWRRSPASARRRRVGPFREAFERLVSDKNFLKRQQLLCVYIGSSRESHRFDVARRFERCWIERIRNQQNFPRIRLFFQQRQERLGFQFWHHEFIDCQNIPSVDPLAQCFLKSETTHGFWNLFGIIAALVRRRLHRHAKLVTICSRPGRGRFPFVARALRRID